MRQAGAANSLSSLRKQGPITTGQYNFALYRLVYVEAYERVEEAIAREKQLKRWKRDWKIELIERDNLEWRDLSDLLV